MKTLQQAFNTAAEHLINQKSRSITYTGACAYRGDFGAKCAVGVLIEDEHYDSDLEGASSFGEKVIEALSKSGYPTNSTAMNLYRDLQFVHDCNPIGHWPAELRGIASHHKLEIPPCLCPQESTASLG
jgi:hypothetical protein